MTIEPEVDEAEAEIPDEGHHDRAVELANGVLRHCQAKDVVAFAAITIASDGEVKLHQPDAGVADEPLVVFALIGALQAISGNLTEMLKDRGIRERQGKPATIN